MLLRGSFAAPQPQNTFKRTQKVWLDSRTAPHPVQYTRTPCTSATARCVSFIHSSVAHKHARNGHALCDTKLNTLVARSRHFSQVVSPASPSSSLHVRTVVVRLAVTLLRTGAAFVSILCRVDVLLWLSSWLSCGTVFCPWCALLWI